MAGKVTRVYADALFEAAKDQGKLPERTAEAAGLRRVLAENRELSDFLNHPQIGRREKKEAARRILEGRLSEEMMGFLETVLDKDRQKWLEGILAEFERQSREYRQIGSVLVEAPMELDTAQKQRIEDRLLSTTKYKKLEVTYQVKPELIGGLVIRIGDRVADSSIKTRLEQLKGMLLAVRLPENQAREGESIL